MSTFFSDPYLNELLARIQSYESKVPRDEQERRDFELAIGKLQMAMQAQGAQLP
jgi:hypothetical protein